ENIWTSAVAHYQDLAQYDELKWPAIGVQYARPSGRKPRHPAENQECYQWPKSEKMTTVYEENTEAQGGHERIYGYC
ncbi:UNVERIFIED_CONTAM: hypothetical protein NY603_35675, partial [Bacteroidetes bacterium 56_B9]